MISQFNVHTVFVPWMLILLWLIVDSSLMYSSRVVSRSNVVFKGESVSSMHLSIEFVVVVVVALSGLFEEVVCVWHSGPARVPLDPCVAVLLASLR